MNEFGLSVLAMVLSFASNDDLALEGRSWVWIAINGLAIGDSEPIGDGQMNFQESLPMP